MAARGHIISSETGSKMEVNLWLFQDAQLNTAPNTSSCPAELPEQDQDQTSDQPSEAQSEAPSSSSSPIDLSTKKSPELDSSSSATAATATATTTTTTTTASQGIYYFLSHPSFAWLILLWRNSGFYMLKLKPMPTQLSGLIICLLFFRIGLSQCCTQGWNNMDFFTHRKNYGIAQDVVTTQILRSPCTH